MVYTIHLTLESRSDCSSTHPQRTKELQKEVLFSPLRWAFLPLTSVLKSRYLDRNVCGTQPPFILYKPEQHS